MKVPILKNFCCCFSLETGSIIASWTSLIMAVLQIIGLIFNSVSSNTQNTTATIVFGLIYGLIWILISIMLLKGIKRRLPRYIQYWIIFQIFVIALNIIGCFVQSIISIFNNRIGEGLSIIFFAILINVISAYLVIVVFNFKKEISTDNNQQA